MNRRESELCAAILELGSNGESFSARTLRCHLRLPPIPLPGGVVFTTDLRSLELQGLVRRKESVFKRNIPYVICDEGGLQKIATATPPPNDQEIRPISEHRERPMATRALTIAGLIRLILRIISGLLKKFDVLVSGWNSAPSR